MILSTNIAESSITVPDIKYGMYILTKLKVLFLISITVKVFFKSLAPILVVSTKCSDPWILEFLVSNTTGNNQWENCISLDCNFLDFSEPQIPQKLEPHD